MRLNRLVGACWFASLLVLGCLGDVAPLPPEDLVAEAGNGEVILAWESSLWAQSHQLFWSDDGSTPPSPGSFAVDDVVSPFVHTGLTNDTTYRYVVLASNQAGTSEASNETEATPTGVPPPAPSEVAASPGDGVVRLTFAPSVGATTYHAYCTDDGSSPNRVHGTKIGPIGSPFDHSGVRNSVTYRYALTATNKYGESAESPVVTATPVEPPSEEVGQVEIAFTLCCATCCRDRAIGFAIWIEDEAGSYVDTIVRYSRHAGAYRGYENAALPQWAAVATSQVDGVSAASGYNGQSFAYSWDGRDRTGAQMPHGTYSVNLEVTDWNDGSHVTRSVLTFGPSPFLISDTNYHVQGMLQLTYTPE